MRPVMATGEMRLGLLALGLGMALAGEARALTADGAVSDCGQPASRAERVICADPDLKAADILLARLAAQFRQRAQDQAGVAAGQLDWVRRRDRMCAPGLAPDCLRIAYAEREAWIQAQLLALPPPVAAAPPPAAQPPAAPPPVPQAPAVPPPAPTSLPLAPWAIPFAQRLGTAPCAAVSSDALRLMGWSAADAPFGLPLAQWSKPDFAALIRRSAECQAENGDNPRNVRAMAVVLIQLRAVAPDRMAETSPPSAGPVAPPPPAPSPVPASPAPSRPAGAEASPASLNCADPALLQDVSFTFQATPQLSGGARIQRLANPRPYTDVIMEAYGATPALRAEYQRLRPYMAPVPQCLVNAETSQGEVVLSYRLYVEGGHPLVEVQRVP
jgi:uncharacterized protein YecT (DUF1311 family)